MGSKMAPAVMDTCLLESIACTNADKCVNNFVKMQKQRELKKEKEGQYVPPAIEKAIKYDAAGAKTKSPTVAPVPKTKSPTGAPSTKLPTVSPTAMTQAPTTKPPTEAPSTKLPTVSPTATTQAPTTKPPTVSPTAKTESPTEAPVAKTVPPATKSPAGGANGDPHIKTWDGETYDFHGICDLLLLHNPQFHDGLGMDIHIRTKKTRHWSYISNLVLRIGDDTFEVMAKRKHNYYWINFVAGEELTKEMTLPTTISSFPIHYKRVNSQKLEYIIDLGSGEKIKIQTWNDFVRVDIVNPTVENFGSSVGLMGTFDKSLKVARDNKTVMTDLNEFGQEWQVLPTEPKLFHEIDGPQAPQRCEIPLKTELRRRLAESKVTREDAEFACADVENKEEFELCVFDVIATSDENVAGAY